MSYPSQQPIPFHRPSLGVEEQEQVAQVLASGWLTSGPKVAQFEEEFRTFVQARHAVAVSSGTAGLHLAMEAFGIGRGDEVITTPLTFCATVQAILHTGATPVLADIGADGNIDPAAVAASITPRTRAIIPVHLGGLPCDMEALWRLARSHDLLVIEDAAHAIGGHYKNAPIGTTSGDINATSDAVVFSFYATKSMTSAEGGMVTAPREDIAARMRRLSLHGIDRDVWKRGSKGQSWKYDVVETGWKYNLSDLQAAVGLAQLRKMPAFLETRRKLAAFYRERLGHLDELEQPPASDHDHDHSWHLYSLRLRLDKLRIDRDTFIDELYQRGVAASVHFIPVPLHSAFAQQSIAWQRDCPQAMQLYYRLVSIPLYPGLTAEESERVAEAVKEVATKFRPLQFAGYTGSRSEFLLNRPHLIDPATEDRYQALFRQEFENRRILVTGVAGSIGRRLCAYLLRLKAPVVFGLDRWENGVFQLQGELARNFASQSFELRVGDVCDEAALAEMVQRFRPDIVIHAAAYKHVPLMEVHPLEAIRNNALGTWCVAKAAAASQARSLLLISTDKAANPAGIMGKTKRLAEEIVTALSPLHPEMGCASLRLGNVLGSDGSVSSTLLDQLEHGRPFTITHPDVQRYFLTPEEAAHYILRALLHAWGGEVLVPEMGEPVRIQDLAVRLAQAEGRTSNHEAKIEIIGLRLGEKVTEDLKSDGASFLPTADNAIHSVREPAPAWPDLNAAMMLMEEHLATRNTAAALQLLEQLTANISSATH